MRRLLIALLLVAVAVPAGTAAARKPKPANDGNLAVREGKGAIVINARGAVIGQIAQGRLVVNDVLQESGAPVIRGADWIRDRWNSTTYGGKNIRFRIERGKFSIRIEQARGVFLSVVGSGRVRLDGAGTFDRPLFNDGFFSFNGEPERSLPDDPTWFNLRAPAPS
jgi:hypothetical protein